MAKELFFTVFNFFREGLTMTKTNRFQGLTATLLTVLAVNVLLASAAPAATLTPETKLLFTGTIGGSAGNWTYTAGPGEVIPAEFKVWADENEEVVTISSGVGTWPDSSTAVDAGFMTACPAGPLATTSYVIEALVKPTAYAIAGNTWGRSYIADINGLDMFFNGAEEATATFNVSALDATKTYKSSSISSELASSQVPKDAWTHVAIVQDTTAETASFYLNGVLVNSFSTGTFPGGHIQRPLLTWNDVYAPGNPIGIGNIGGEGGWDARVIDGNFGFSGEMAGWALSSFTGTLDPQTDFVLSEVPEPGTLALLGTGLLGLLACAWRKRR